MDDIVRQALLKWPNVPHTYGWLALDRRGDWYLRDDAAQAAGAFPAVKGSRIEHEKLRDFIGRNYLADERGCWYFQNGPQKVFVELEAAPWVWRLGPGRGDDDEPAVTSHTGLPARVASTWLDPEGRLFLATELGLGLVHSLDQERAADAVEVGVWAPEDTPFEELPSRFGYCLRPVPPRART